MSNQSRYGLIATNRVFSEFKVGEEEGLWDTVVMRFPQLKNFYTKIKNSGVKYKSVFYEEKSLLALINRQHEATVFLEPLVPNEKVVAKSIQRFSLGTVQEATIFSTIDSAGNANRYIYLHPVDMTEHIQVCRQQEGQHMGPVPISLLN